MTLKIRHVKKHYLKRDRKEFYSTKKFITVRESPEPTLNILTYIGLWKILESGKIYLIKMI